MSASKESWGEPGSCEGEPAVEKEVDELCSFKPEHGWSIITTPTRILVVRGSCPSLASQGCGLGPLCMQVPRDSVQPHLSALQQGGASRKGIASNLHQLSMHLATSPGRFPPLATQLLLRLPQGSCTSHSRGLFPTVPPAHKLPPNATEKHSLLP